MVNRRFGTPFDVTPGGVGTGTAACNDGELLIGGGFGAQVPDGCTVVALDFNGDGGDWFVAVRCDGGSQADDLSAIAFCLAIE